MFLWCAGKGTISAVPPRPQQDAALAAEVRSPSCIRARLQPCQQGWWPTTHSSYPLRAERRATIFSAWMAVDSGQRGKGTASAVPNSRSNTTVIPSEREGAYATERESRDPYTFSDVWNA